MGVLLAAVRARGGTAGMIKPSIRRHQGLENQGPNSAIELAKLDSTEDTSPIQKDSGSHSETSFSLLIATKIKSRIPSVPLQSPSAKRLTMGLRQTLRSASGTLRKLTHPREKLPTSKKQVVQDVLNHRRLSRKKL